VIGAWVRHFFNLRHTGRTVWAIPVSAAVAIAVLAVLIRPQGESSGGTSAVPFASAARIVRVRCAACHSVHPTLVTAAPLGLTLDRPAEIRRYASNIRDLAVSSKTMPLGNATHMTDAERRTLGQWIAQGAKIP
jgi:uncharacterized membrane protein